MAWHTEELLVRTYNKTQAINYVQKVHVFNDDGVTTIQKSQTMHILELKQLSFQANRQVFLNC